MSSLISRRGLLTGIALAAPALLVGCDRLGAFRVVSWRCL